jgi:hypothetical protein
LGSIWARIGSFLPCLFLSVYIGSFEILLTLAHLLYVPKLNNKVIEFILELKMRYRLYFIFVVVPVKLNHSRFFLSFCRNQAFVILRKSVTIYANTASLTGTASDYMVSITEQNYCFHRKSFYLENTHLCCYNCSCSTPSTFRKWCF